MQKNKHLWTSLVVGLVVAGGAVAGNVTLPNVFQPNTPARASEVNANFAAVKTAVDDSHSSILTLQTSVSAVQGSVASLQSADAQNWKRGGNTGTTSTDYLGTADAQPLELRVNASRALQIVPGGTTAGSPSVVFGGAVCPATIVTGVSGAFIGGGNARGRLLACVGSTAERHRAYDHNVVIAGGYGNAAGSNDADLTNAEFAAVSGGVFNAASGYASHVGGGDSNVASGSLSSVIGGYQNQATATSSLAGGTRAQAAHSGAIVLSDSSSGTFSSTVANQFAVRAAGGVFFGSGTSTQATMQVGSFIGTSTGAFLSSGGTWTNSSDRALKENMKPVAERQVLSAVRSLPIYSWNYRSEDPAVRHVGPTAQDFAERFFVGTDDKHIATVDADGVALAAIKGLAEVVEEQNALISQQRKALQELEARLRALEKR